MWFYIYWLWCELWACPIQIFAKILILKSTYLFWTWKPPIWPTSLKYWQCPKLRLPKSKFEIHPFSLDSLKVILQTASRLSFWRTNELSQGCLKLKITLGHYFNLPFSFSVYRFSTYLSRSLPVSRLPFSFGTYHFHKKFSSAILKYPSTILHLSTINRRVGFIENLSRKNTLNHEMKICFFQIFKSSFSQSFLIVTSSFSIPSN